MLSHVYFGNTLRAWIVAAVIALVVYGVLAVLRRAIAGRLAAIASRTNTDVDNGLTDLIRNTRPFFIAAVAIGAATRGLIMPPRIAVPIAIVLELLVLLQIGLWISGLISFLVERSLTKRRETADRIGVAAVRAIGVTVKVTVWVVLVVVALQFIFDRNVSALVTGIGIGGVALALAVQNILGDILAAVAIVFDRPFDVGDFVAVDPTTMGSVEQIGLKTTRLRSLTGEQLVIGNAELLKSKLRNYKRMYERRVAFTLDVTYDTPPDVVAGIPATVKAVVETQSPVRFDRSHFASFADSSLRIETVYYVLDPDYNRYMDIQQAINMEILRRFSAAGIEFAFPTRTIYTAGSAIGPATSPASGAPARQKPQGSEA
jgi:small-conductance mechanosensitive channel